MKRLGHGEVKKSAVSPQGLAPQGIAAASNGDPQRTVDSFGFMINDWTTAEKLPNGAQTLVQLRALGSAMKDQDGEQSDSGIPAAYTYFGQFVDHDITHDTTSATLPELAGQALLPLPDLSGLRNDRTAATELDSVYFLGVPREQANKNRLRLSDVSKLGGIATPNLRPVGKKDANDLPRQARHVDKDEDRAAIIGDPRNDENTIVAQMHTAFLKAHNSLVDGGLNFDEARREMILRYQSVILDDFLKRICHRQTYERIRANGPTFWKLADGKQLFMPVEFAFAAYRFGHSMVRTQYDFNLNFNLSGETNTFPAGLDLLFTFTALSGGFNAGGGNGTDTLPENWIIEWERILPMGNGSQVQNAHAIDVQLTNFLFALRNKLGDSEGSEPGTPPAVKELAPILATRNLLRGFMIGLPTGQAVARRMGIAPLEGQALLDALPTQALKDAATPFQDRSPLWFYVLAEAGSSSGGGGRTLGEVGSTLVTETLFMLIRHSEVSILRKPDNKRPSTTLAEIIALAARQDA